MNCYWWMPISHGKTSRTTPIRKVCERVHSVIRPPHRGEYTGIYRLAKSLDPRSGIQLPSGGIANHCPLVGLRAAETVQTYRRRHCRWGRRRCAAGCPTWPWGSDVSPGRGRICRPPSSGDRGHLYSKTPKARTKNNSEWFELERLHGSSCVERESNPHRTPA